MKIHHYSWVKMLRRKARPLVLLVVGWLSKLAALSTQNHCFESEMNDLDVIDELSYYSLHVAWYARHLSHGDCVKRKRPSTQSLVYWAF